MRNPESRQPQRFLMAAPEAVGGKEAERAEGILRLETALVAACGHLPAPRTQPQDPFPLQEEPYDLVWVLPSSLATSLPTLAHSQKPPSTPALGSLELTSSHVRKLLLAPALAGQVLSLEVWLPTPGWAQ